MKNILSYSAVLALLSLAPTVLAGYNCKCQDPSGTGPQWNVETEKVCGYLEGDTGCYSLYHADQHHQCSASTGCLDSGRFVKLCKDLGTPGAYCWK